MDRTIEECIEKVRQDCRDNIEQIKADTEANIKLIESNFLARRLLAGENIVLELNYWRPHAAELVLDDVRKMPLVRKALGVPLKATGHKEPIPHCRKFVAVYFKAEGFDGLSIQVKMRLREGQQARCKVVKVKRTYTYRTVVCEKPADVRR